MKIQSVEFVKSATAPADAPKERLPEIAFLGPSNVGKSTLINCLTGRKALARVSRTPGRTQLLNYFRVNERLFFVDLPGYGFAKAPRRVQDELRRRVEGYLAGSSRLALLALLLDSRREPSERDTELQGWLVEQDVPHVVVLTKSDKLSPSELRRRVQATESALGLDELGACALAFSARSGLGKRELWGIIAEALEQAAEEARASVSRRP